jgi:hypothetical protein
MKRTSQLIFGYQDQSLSQRIQPSGESIRTELASPMSASGERGGNGRKKFTL